MNDRGFSLVQALVVLGVMSLINLGTITVMQRNNRTNHEINMKANVLAMRQNIVALIGNQNSWAQTYAVNFSMMCRSPGQTYCNPNSTQVTPIKLMDSGGNVVVDTVPTAGFTLQGEPCNQYSPTGNDACPLRVEVFWRAGCTPATCSNAVVASGRILAEEFVSLRFTYSPSSSERKFSFNSLNYNLVEQSRMRLQNNASPSVICGDQGKIYVGTGRTLRGYSSDSLGCIDYAAFFGDKGDTGAMGPTGPMGPMGPMGPAGASVTCP
ncbi:type II secretion system protein [Bdellovibrio bacteriovorus]|uniref:type II secretion system protein n=1 Tax=Bdellovibrio bacteriovorus TaxID=959 RepID=UPI0035A572C8